MALRLIYGENNKRTLDQRAIAWVILNRYHGTGFGSTSQIFESGGVLYAHYSSRDVAISKACIAGAGTATTIAGLKVLCTSSLSNYNVFFYHE